MLRFKFFLSLHLFLAEFHCKFCLSSGSDVHCTLYSMSPEQEMTSQSCVVPAVDSSGMQEEELMQPITAKLSLACTGYTFNRTVTRDSIG